MVMQNGANKKRKGRRIMTAVVNGLMGTISYNRLVIGDIATAEFR